MSYRAKLQASFFVLGLLAIAVTAWQATSGATQALRRATTDHLTAVRETKRRLVEDYVRDLTGHVLALSADESGVSALEAFRSAWNTLTPVGPEDPQYEELRRHYLATFVPRVAGQLSEQDVARDWFPADAKTRALQHQFIVANPHPVGSKDLLLEPKVPSAYGDAHARFHPTLHRYQTVFGFYDVFLIDARDGRILYSVFKEIDLGQRVTEPPFSQTALARAYTRALQVSDTDMAVIEDYAPYPASYFAPAAFVAAPIRRAGNTIGVLAIQVSINRVNRMMTSDRDWADEGLGQTGHTYIVAADGTLRSDVRAEIEDSERFLSAVASSGVPADVIGRIRRHGTAILNLAIPAAVTARLTGETQGTELGTDFVGAEVLRSHARLDLPGLHWFIVAEMQSAEAFAPASALLRRLLLVGGGVTLAFLVAAWLLAESVTRPVLALVEGTRALSQRDFQVRLPAESADEIGQLALSFNAMAERLERTTVSRDDLDRANQQLTVQQHELRELAARLIRAQEDERSRIARELHDDLSQRLAAASIAIGNLAEQATGRTDPAALTRVHADLAQIARDVHGLSRRLHPSVLDDLGLLAAIESECRGFFERGGPPVRLTHGGSLDGIDRETQIALYRVVQEALRNAYTHADASDVEIHLDGTGTEVMLTIADNGRGYDTTAPSWRPGLGLASMAERARLLGGSSRITSRPGEGTTISVRLMKTPPETGQQELTRS